MPQHPWNRQTGATLGNAFKFSSLLCVSVSLQTVSYAQFLLPTNALVRQKSSAPLDTCTVQTTRNFSNNQKNFTNPRLNSTVGQEPGVLRTQSATELKHG